jgi:hypothetical protein
MTFCMLIIISRKTRAVLLQKKLNECIVRYLSHRIPILPTPVEFFAVDGYKLHGQYWGHEGNHGCGAVLITTATGSNAVTMQNMPLSCQVMD